jgi:hypothetical protein
MSFAYRELHPPPPSVADRLVEAGRSVARSQYDVVRLAAEFEESTEWYLSFTTPAHWIAAQLDVCVSTAREWIRIGKALRTLPAVDAAFEGHELSYAKVRALTRVARPESEDESVGLARSVPAGRLGHALAAWTQRHEDHDERTARHAREKSLRHRVDPDGTVTFTVRLGPDDAAETLAGIEAIVMRNAHTAKPQEVVDLAAEGANCASAGASASLARQRADAFVDLVTDGGVNIETEVVLHVRGDGCSYDDGTPVTDTVVERLVSTSFLRALIHDAEARPINASSRRRYPSVRQKRVVRERDRCCVDCGATELLEYDHVPSFDRSGRTVVDELRLRCAPCHRRRHAHEGWAGMSSSSATRQAVPDRFGVDRGRVAQERRPEVEGIAPTTAAIAPSLMGAEFGW